MAHRHGARILLDAAQLTPHRPIDMTATDVDYVALSGHKLYAPLGAGALIGRRDWLTAGQPMLAGRSIAMPDPDPRPRPELAFELA